MQKDSTLGTLVVATALCVFCSVIVSGLAVQLKPRQAENKALDIKKNLLLASGLITNPSATKEEILQAYDKVQAEVVNLETGEKTDIDPSTFDQRKARKDPSRSKAITVKDTAGIKTRSKFSTVYKVVEGGTTKLLILPVNGKGLWSTLYGFIALEPDTRTVAGLGFYEHAETPGLGGEVDNPRWKASWKGKMALDENFKPVIHLVKGLVSSSDPDANKKIDGLSGATITAVGVTGLVQYWLGDDGFGPYLAKFRGGSN